MLAVCRPPGVWAASSGTPSEAGTSAESTSGSAMARFAWFPRDQRQHFHLRFRWLGWGVCQHEQSVNLCEDSADEETASYSGPGGFRRGRLQQQDSARQVATSRKSPPRRVPLRRHRLHRLHRLRSGG